MNTPEIQRIRERGVLAVGVRDDMPLFAEGGEGFEIELAQKIRCVSASRHRRGMRRQNSSP